MPLSQQQTTEIKKQYDPIRQRAKQQEAANLQTQNDAMARRAAAQGGGPGGAYEKQAQLVQGQSAERLQAANEGIDAQEAGAMNQAREVQAQRDYQTAERLGSQQFAAGQTKEQMAFTRRENQDAAINAANAQMRQIQAAAAEGKLTRAQADKQLAELQRQYDLDLVENKKTNAINSLISAFNSKIPPEAMGKLLGDLGIDVSQIPGLTAEGEMSPAEKQLQKNLSQMGAPGGGGLPPGATGIFTSGPNKGKPMYPHATPNGGTTFKPYPQEQRM